MEKGRFLLFPTTLSVKCGGYLFCLVNADDVIIVILARRIVCVCVYLFYGKVLCWN